MDMLHEVRRMIREGMAEYKALSTATDMILRRMAQLNYGNVDKFLKGEKEAQVMFSQRVNLYDLKQIMHDPELSGTDLASMISHYRTFMIHLSYTSANNKSKADYRAAKDEAGRTLSVSITLFYRPEFIERVKSDTLIPKGEEYLFRFLWNEFHSSLVHELRHAVDDHRFQDIVSNKGGEPKPVFQGLQPINSKAFALKTKYSDVRLSPDSNKEAWLSYHEQYLRFPHEVWARFSQVVHGTEFKREDADTMYAMMPDGSPGKTYIMTPMADVIERLKTMYGWNALGEKQRRRLVRAMSNLWHEEAKWVEANNREVAKYL